MRPPISTPADNYDPHVHLATVQSLCSELEAGHFAIVNNRLDDLRQHVARQEDLCSQLAMAIEGAAVVRSDGQRVTPAMMNEISAAHNHLVRLNRRTAVLLRHCRRTVDLLRTHYAALLDPALTFQHRSWSSEV
jgi:hypothetical protein